MASQSERPPADAVGSLVSSTQTGSRQTTASHPWGLVWLDFLAKIVCLGASPPAPLPARSTALSFAANTRGGCYSAGTGPTPWAGHWQEAEADRGRSALPGVHVSQGSSAQLTHRHTHTQTQGSRAAIKCQVWGFHWKAMARPAGVRQNLRGSRRMPSPEVSCTCVLRTSAGSGLVSRPASPHMPPACLCSTWPSASFVPTDAAVFSFPTPPSPAH